MPRRVHMQMCSCSNLAASSLAGLLAGGGSTKHASRCPRRLPPEASWLAPAGAAPARALPLGAPGRDRGSGAHSQRAVHRGPARHAGVPHLLWRVLRGQPAGASHLHPSLPSLPWTRCSGFVRRGTPCADWEAAWEALWDAWRNATRNVTWDAITPYGTKLGTMKQDTVARGRASCVRSGFYGASFSCCHNKTGALPSDPVPLWLLLLREGGKPSLFHATCVTEVAHGPSLCCFNSNVFKIQVVLVAACFRNKCLGFDAACSLCLQRRVAYTLLSP